MANAFDTLFRRGPTLGESADYFIRLKKFAAPEDQGMALAQSGAPFQDQVIQFMLQMVQNEFKTMLAYKVYAQTVRGPGREGMAEEFEEHAENEIEHADFLLRRLSVLLGGPVPVPDIPPPAPLDDPNQILEVMIQLEQEGIENWKQLLGLLGDNPTKHEVENILTREVEHVDELFQFMPPQSAMAAEGEQREAGAEPQLPAKEQSQQGQPGTPQSGGGPEAGQPPAVKLSSVGSFLSTSALAGLSGGLSAALPTMSIGGHMGNLKDPVEGYDRGSAGAGMGTLAGGFGGATAGRAIGGAMKHPYTGAAIGAGLGALGGAVGGYKAMTHEKTAARQRFTRDDKGNIVQIPARYEGNLEDQGSFSTALDEAFKLAMAKTAAIHIQQADKIPGNVSRDGTKGSSEAKTPDPCQDLDAFAQGGKEGAVKLGMALAKLAFNGTNGPPQSGIKNDKGDPNAFEPTDDPKDPQPDKTAAKVPENLTRAKERGEANAVARATQFRGQRGELYGDLAGRLLGGTAGFLGSKRLGEGLPRVMAAGLSQAAGGRVGKMVGREIDSVRAKKKTGAARTALEMSKTALEDEMQASQWEQMAEQAEMANSARFYQDRATQHADALKSLQAELQSAQQKAQEHEATIQQLQSTMQQNSDVASQTTTQALLQAVQANTASIQQRQIAADAANANQTLRDQLRQLADGPSAGNPQGPQDPQGAIQGPSGGPTSGAGLQELQDGPGNAPPAGESNAYQPIQPIQDSGDGKPTGQASLSGDTRQPSTPSEYSDGGKGKMGSVLSPEIVSKLKSHGFGAAAGAGLGAADSLLSGSKWTGKKLEERKKGIEKMPEGYTKDLRRSEVSTQSSKHELAKKHPGASAASHAMGGAMLGGALGPAVVSAGKKVLEHIKKK